MAEKNKDIQTEEGGGSKKKLLVVIAAGVLVVIIAIIAVYFLLLKQPPPPDPQKEQVEMIEPLTENEAEIGPMLEITEFIVNIISEDGNHYVKASLSLELSSDVVMEEATKRMPQIRDAILLLISNKTFEELQDLQGKKQIKAEMKSKINSFLTSGRVKNIYLTDFVVQ